MAIVIAELEQTRNEIYPQYQRLVEAEQLAQRKRKIEELRKQHEQDQMAEQAADRALLEARERSNRSFFNWKVAVDQESMAEFNAATERQKEEWARNAGPNARAH